MKHVEEIENLLYRIRRSGLLPVPESGISDEDLFRRIDKDEFVIELHPANLIIWKDASIEVWLLDIQERELFYRGLTLECFFLSGNGHTFSSLLTNCSNDSESIEFDLFVTFVVIRFIRNFPFG